ncbi:MAG: hypothetical protein ABR517_06030 [Thermoanaerobaculia bacterium]
MFGHDDIRWIRIGIVGGLAASALYPVLLFAPLPLAVTAAVAALLGPAIGVGSLGLYHLVRLHGSSVAAALGAILNLLAGCLFTAMALVQLAVRARASEGARDLVGVWLGLDVAWDVYIGLGTLAFGWAVRRHPRFGWAFAVSGLSLGLLVIVLNLIPFPIPPAEAGSFDIGPFVGLWYLAATIQAWRSLPWAREQLSKPERDKPPVGERADP